MDAINELKQKFEEKLAGESRRVIIFWYDNNPDRDLDEISQALSDMGIRVWELKKNNSFQTQYQLEIADPLKSYLVYARFPKPNDSDVNPLLDILLYSSEFKADDIALLISRYQLDHLAIRPFIEDNRAFFNDQVRRSKLEKLLPEKPTTGQLQLGMLAVLTGSQSIHLPDIVRRLLVKGLSEETNQVYRKISSFFDVNLFWQIVGSYFGLDLKDTENCCLQHLFKALVYNHFDQEIDFDVPLSLSEQYKSRLPNTCRLFIEDWFASIPGEVEVLEDYLAQVEMEWDVDSLIDEYDYEKYERSYTFRAVEWQLMGKLLAEIANETVDVETWNNRLALRKTGHWASKEEFYQLYAVLEPALKLFSLKEQHQAKSRPQDARQWFEQYRDFYYQIDQAYRQMMLAYKDVQHYDDLAACVERFTNWYENVYLQNVAGNTDRLIREKFSAAWPITSARQQRDFYQQSIEPLLKKNVRVFVIISDALRFEAGEELSRRLRQRVNADVQLEAMQAILPGYTQLGMAGLLPWGKLDLRDDEAITVDGISSRGLENRQRILQKKEAKSGAFKLHDVLNNVTEGAERVKGLRVIYLYHDRIDALGDSQKSEEYTFEAVNDALHELERAVQKLLKSFGAKRIFITADHGFLYQYKKLGADRKAPAIGGKVIDGNRRFAVGKHLTASEGAAKISLRYLGMEHEAVIATGLNRFTAHGGMQFVHGGALPQESIIPVIECHGPKKEPNFVAVRVAMKEKIITNYRIKVTLFQEQKVSADMQPRHLRVAFYQGDERISNEVTLVFDRAGDAAARHQEVFFALIERPYEMGERCELRMYDEGYPKTEPHKETFELRLYDALY